MKKLVVFLLLLCSASAFAQTITVKPGDTLSKLLEDAYKLDEIIAIDKELKAQKPGFMLRSGMQAEKTNDMFTLQLAEDCDVCIYRQDGVPRVSVITHETEVHPFVVMGTINTNLFNAIKDIGEDTELAASLARIFEWEFDFFRDIRQGDTFTVLVEKKFVKGEYTGYGQILAAEFVIQNRSHKAFYFNDNAGYGYYDQNGNALERGFLRVPLSYSKITSRFTNNRLHPVLGINRPHYGVDYAAPIGTPVMATATGTIVNMRYTSSNGNYVEIRHANGYKTYYLHLNSFNRAFKVGSVVSQGQVIGYVGKTGYATGPHLDYRIQHNGRWINPTQFQAETVKLADDDKNRFLEVAARYETRLQANSQYVNYYIPTLTQ